MKVKLTRLLLIVVLIFFGFSTILAQNSLEPANEIILVTGFEPFGGLSINSSWEAVSQLDGLVLEDGRQIVSLQLPVVWETADDLLFNAIIEYQPVLVINVGQGGSTLELEQYAHNRNGSFTDNLGMVPPASFISESGPDVYTTQIDINSVLDRLDELELTISVGSSESAGSYLCNFISYNSYDYLATYYPNTPTLFVHVPPVTDLTLQSEKLADIVAALEVIIIEASTQSPGLEQNE